MKIGFTGTRKGMTADQRILTYRLLSDFKPTHIHHGCCIGADEDFDVLLTTQSYGKSSCKKPWVTVHPSTLQGMTSLPAFAAANTVLPVKPPLARNGDIVRAVDLMIAAPFEMEEQRRGGTWYTIRLAKRLNKLLIIIYPDGSTWRNFEGDIPNLDTAVASDATQ